MLELVLARHGQSYGNLDRSLGPDTGLSDRGRQQAARLRDWLIQQDYAFTALYCSTLRRARQTAEIINEHYGLEIVSDPGLREAGEPYLHHLPRRADPLAGGPPAPFGPGYEALRGRVARATARILAEVPEGQALVVAHSGTLGTMLRSILGTHAFLVRTEQAATHCLRWDDGRWTLQYLNRREYL
jgi:broad specificity phosphatase PhoE